MADAAAQWVEWLEVRQLGVEERDRLHAARCAWLDAAAAVADARAAHKGARVVEAAVMKKAREWRGVLRVHMPPQGRDVLTDTAIRLVWLPDQLARPRSALGQAEQLQALLGRLQHQPTLCGAPGVADLLAVGEAHTARLREVGGSVSSHAQVVLAARQRAAKARAALKEELRGARVVALRAGVPPLKVRLPPPRPRKPVAPSVEAP